MADRFEILHASDTRLSTSLSPGSARGHRGDPSCSPDTGQLASDMWPVGAGLPDNNCAAVVRQCPEEMVKTPKLHLVDSGLLATIRGLTFDRVKANRGMFGALLESFVFSEVQKLTTASDLRLAARHFRDRDGREVDVFSQRDDGMIVGIEVKASATVKTGDFSGLTALAEAAGDRFA